MATKDEFIERLTRIIEQNLSSEQFGVAELADEMAVSRSTLLRIVKNKTGLSANQYIKEVRLGLARQKLDETDKTVAEISFETGFSSPSYFIKCFKDQYGYSPGEHRHLDRTDETPNLQTEKSGINKFIPFIAAVILIALIGVIFFRPKSQSSNQLGKSIAVLPFKNESADSTNKYFVNGMMESILNNLQKIEDIRVVSRTSVEKYRQLRISTPEIARDLGVDYIVEGSGQRFDDSILLSVQLIAAEEDRHLWSEQYQRKLADVFALQAEVSKNIASQIEVVIKPEENERIEAVPTRNIAAYDLFYRGMEFINSDVEANLDSALRYYDAAMQLDPDFANPYAYSAICFYYKDLFMAEKNHLDQLGEKADKALLLNSTLPEALIAKGMYYMLKNQYLDAIEYFEKALEFNPNSAWTHNFLSEIYHQYLPNTEKYLIHALSALQLDLSKTDSADVSITHLILSNAFAQSGIMNKAKEHVQISLDFDPDNIFSMYLDIFIDVANDSDLDEARARMEKVYEFDTTRLDVLKELASLCMSQEDYESSYNYFDQFLSIKERFGFNLFPEEDITIAFVMRTVGDTTRARQLRKSFDVFVEENNTIYKPFLRTMALLYDGENSLALDSYEEFSKNEDYMFWLLLVEEDPLFRNVRNTPRFQSILGKMKAQFEERKKQRIALLKELGLW